MGNSSMAIRSARPTKLTVTESTVYLIATRCNTVIRYRFTDYLYIVSKKNQSMQAPSVSRRLFTTPYKHREPIALLDDGFDKLRLHKIFDWETMMPDQKDLHIPSEGRDKEQADSYFSSESHNDPEKLDVEAIIRASY